MKSSMTPIPTRSSDTLSWHVLLVAGWLAAALMGIYHNPDRVGVEIYDFQLTIEQLNLQGDSDNQIRIGTMQKQVSFAALALLGVVLAVRRSPAPWQGGAMAWLIAGCLGWACLSYTWSYESPVTLRELLRLLVAALVAFGLARNFSPRQATFIVLVAALASVTVALTSEISGGFFKPWQGDHRLQGGMHANMVAVHAGFLALAAQALRSSSSRRSLYLLLMAIGIGSLLLTKSRTGLAAYGVSALVLWSIRLDPRRAAGYWAVGSTLLATGLLVVAIGGPALTRAFLSTTTMGREVEAGSLTGRLPLWAAVAHDIARRPLTGYGYEAFWTAERRESIAHDINWYPTDAHSIYVNTLLEQGLVGFSLNLLLVIWGGWTLLAAYRSTNQVGYAFFASLAAYLLFHGIAEAGCSAARISGLFIGSGMFYAAGWREPAEAVQPNHVNSPLSGANWQGGGGALSLQPFLSDPVNPQQ